MVRVLAASTLFLHLLGVALAQDPPNLADSNVPYTLPTTAKYDYAEVIHKSLLFYHAQRSGKLGPNRRLAWRGDSCFDCIGPNGEDLSGGYFEAANTMKWGLPLAWTLTQLAFNIHTFPEALQAVNEYEEALQAVKWGTDYLVNCISSPDQFVGQLGVSAIGSTDIDFGYFGPAEEYEMWAPQGVKRSAGIAYINSTNPSSEILGESAAALAATSVIFAQKDKAYSDKLLGHATDLYTRAATNLGSYMRSQHPNLKTVKEWYPSTIYTDELAWGAAWLYVATKDEKYRVESDGWIAKSADHLSEYSWDEKLPGAHMLLFMQTKNQTYQTGIETYFKNFWPGGSVKQTAKGLSYPFSWGSLRYAAATGFLMMAYSKTIGYTNPNSTQTISYAAQQINYMLGDCGRSWVVGFGDNSPIRPYHKSSYNSFIDYPLRGQDNGVQGEDFLHSTTFSATVIQGTYSKAVQVTQDYNAAFTGLNAAMIDYYGSSNFKAFSDCGLDLGWSHKNASNPPQWPENDCYHTCATTCAAVVPEPTGTNGTIGLVGPETPIPTPTGGAARIGVASIYVASISTIVCSIVVAFTV